jgi:hypothetical protein
VPPRFGGTGSHVEHVVVLVDRGPLVVLRAGALDEPFVARPFVTGPWAASARPAGVGLPEFGVSAADRFELTETPRSSMGSTEAKREPKR